MQFQKNERKLQNNQLLCSEHQNETITNYCSSLDCLKPLCPECFQLFNPQFCLGMFSHNQMHKQKHTYPEIESLKGIIMQCQKKLKDANSSIQREIVNLDNSLHEPQLYQQENMLSIQKLKKQVYHLVESYFAELEHKLAQSSSDITKKFMQLTPVIDRMKSFQKEVELMHRTLEAPDNSLISTLQKVNLMDIESILDKFKNDIQKSVQVISLEQLVVRSDDQSNRLQTLRSDIEKAIPLTTLRHNPYQFLMKPSAQKFSMDNSLLVHNTNLEYSRMDETDKQQSPQQSIHDSFQASTIRKQEYFQPKGQKIFFESNKTFSMQVQMPDFFNENSPRKFLHFFQNDSNNLFYIELTQLLEMRMNHQPIEFQIIEINNNFRIPTFHRSLATPNGNLYLTGGTLPDGSGQKSGITYQFDFSTNSLIAISMMQFARSSHGMCYLDGYLYVIGGYEQKHIMTARCERMSPKGRWEAISSLNQVCASMSVCVKEPDQIYKFGGITVGYNGQTISNYIERYDSKTNTWKVVEAQINKDIKFQFLSTSASIQINQNDILIFGGYNEENIGSNQTICLTEQNGQFIIHSINARPLPFSEAFWNSQAIIHECEVFAIQNVSGESEDSCLEDERLILSYNGKEWSLVE